jgi:copper homeostasis protein CutC
MYIRMRMHRALSTQQQQHSCLCALFNIDSQRRITVGQASLACESEQPCMQGKGVTACLAAWVLLSLLQGP